MVASSSWFGLAAPVATPPAVIERLTQAMKQALASPHHQAGMAKIGNEQFTLDAEQSAAFISAEAAKWSAVAKSANIQLE
jgi:tripartite-type tricarboxylate transporter receptor subunit TctC